MDSNLTDSGSRVTRSLRKRLTSVDSDNSSRPGTPVAAKLIPISETSDSPSKSTRITRRNSTSGVATPVKTPSSRRVTASSAVIVENSETSTPARRNLRKRTVSIYENDETTQTSLRITGLGALDEESVPDNHKSLRVTRSQSKSPQQTNLSKISPSPKKVKSFAEIKNVESVEEEKPCVVTRSQSKSPLQIFMSKASQSPNQTKSPEENRNTISEQKNMKSQKGRKPGPKSKTRRPEEETHDISDVEVSIHEHEINQLINKSADVKTIVLTDDNSNLTVDKETEEFDEASEVALNIDNANTSLTEKEALYMNGEQSETKSNSTSSKNTTISSIKITEEPIQIQSEENKKENTSIMSIIQTEETVVDTVNQKYFIENNTNLMENNTNIIENEQDSCVMNNEIECSEKVVEENEISVSVAKGVQLENVSDSQSESTPQPKEKIILPDKFEILSVSSLTPYHREGDSNVCVSKVSSKKIDFVSSPSNDKTIKQVYPKTPASIKLKNGKEISSLKDNDSFQAENDENLLDNKQGEISISDDITEIAIIDKEAHKNKQLKSINKFDLTTTSPVTTFKCARSLEIIQSSTPINAEASKHEELLQEKEEEEEEKKLFIKKNDLFLHLEVKEGKNEEATSSNQIKEDLKWINPSVKGTTIEGSKLDVVVTRTIASTNDCCENVNSFEGKCENNNKKKSIIFSSEDEEKDVLKEEDDSEIIAEMELAPGEKPYKHKHDFHDDEAMEVNDYESGDSMDSEERRDLDENELQFDGESIGSHTTVDDHEEYDEREDSETADSFIVSDNEEFEYSADSNEEEKQIDENKNDSYRNKKRTYKRLQCPMDSSSSSDEELDLDKLPETLKVNDKNDSPKKVVECPNNNFTSQSKTSVGDNDTSIKMKSGSNLVEFVAEENNLCNKYSENIALDSSKLSDSALRLQCSSESESEAKEMDEVEEEYMNISRKQFLRKLNKSDRFNKSVRDLNTESDTSPVANSECQWEAKEITKTIQENEDDKKCASSDEVQTATSPDESNNKTNSGRKIQSESNLGEVSVTSESDADKENHHNSMILDNPQRADSGMTVSFGKNKKHINQTEGSQEWHRSFTVDVTVKGEYPQNVFNDEELKENTPATSSSPSSSSASCDENGQGKLKSKDINYLENIRHMPLPLCNPLIRTRRQSLALPTNPNMEICPSGHASGTVKKSKRKSLGMPSSSEFNPSQSFIDSVELHKNELNRHMVKRKRLSKSFCGASDTLDSSIVDIDVRHLDKRSKLMEDKSIAESNHDSIENNKTSKFSTKASSTPHAKTDSISRILSRCDEILEAANRAKLKAKMNNKKSKIKITKKLKKKSGSALSNETTPVDNDDVLRRVVKDIKRKDKTKTALSQAIRAADVILNQKKPTQSNVGKHIELNLKRLPPDVLNAINEAEIIKKKSKRETRKDHKTMPNVQLASTSAGSFTEVLQTPEKKKRKPTYIQLPTGKVSVEPVTPKTHSARAFNGEEFRESPITPHSVGFRVRLTENNKLSPSISKNGKRKRIYDESTNMRNLPKAQWTQSGLFIEEVISKNLQDVPKKTGKCQSKREQNAICNFKETALMRPDVKRSTKRDILLLKERRQVQSHY